MTTLPQTYSSMSGNQTPFKFKLNASFSYSLPRQLVVAMLKQLVLTIGSISAIHYLIN